MDDDDDTSKIIWRKINFGTFIHSIFKTAKNGLSRKVALKTALQIQSHPTFNIVAGKREIQFDISILLTSSSHSGSIQGLQGMHVGKLRNLNQSTSTVG